MCEREYTSNKRFHTMFSIAQMGPASIRDFLSTISMTHTPVSFWASMRACCMGEAPRYAGRREGCTFSLREGWKSLSIESGRIRPNDAVTSKCCGGASQIAATSENGDGSYGSRGVLSYAWPDVVATRGAYRPSGEFVACNGKCMNG